MWHVGVDVGGTFTDVAALEAGSGRHVVLKLPTTPGDRSIAVLDGIRQVLAEIGCNAGAVSQLAHGTTVATNALIERTGATTALITTEGFRDVLEFRRMNKVGRLDPYDFQIRLPTPLVPRERRYGLRGRLGADGNEVIPLDVGALGPLSASLQADGVEAVAVSLLFSFRNPTHEHQVAHELEHLLPGLYVTLSSDIDPQLLEYERTSTTVVNSYLGPPVRSYLDQIRRKADESGLPTPLIMQSNGGLASVEAAMAEPARLLESGPAAGMVAALALGRALDLSNLIVVDMGGTSFDVGIVLDGEVERATSVEFEGHAVRLPMLDIRSIGAGGGSIAFLDEGRTLRVGPASAGAEPGPACYGRGGLEPTTTDANAVLGYFAGDSLGGGAMSLDRASAEQCISTGIAEPLGMPIEAAAAGIIKVVDANMADAIRAMVTYRGLDPRDFTLVAGGGAGPLHASRLAVELGIGQVVVVPHPGALSAVGLTRADVLHESAGTVSALLVDLDDCSRQLQQAFKVLDDRVRQLFDLDGVPLPEVEMSHTLDLQYYGQSFQLGVPIVLPVDEAALSRCLRTFHDMHRDLYGVADEREVVMALTARAHGSSRRSWPVSNPPPTDAKNARHSTQRAWFPETGRWEQASVFDRAELGVGFVIDGPALIQQADSATLVLPGHRATVLADGSIGIVTR